jgi:hypothetical protein
MYQHHRITGEEYKYIFLKILGADPSPEVIDYFDDIWSQVLPASDMVETRYGYEGIPNVKGVWIRFEVMQHDQISDTEATVGIRTIEPGSESGVISFRMQLVEGYWEATGVTGVGDERILQ